MMFRSLIAPALAIASLVTVTAQRTGAEGPQTLLLSDEHHILYRSGTERVLHPAKRHSDVSLITPDKPWEHLIAWSSIYRNPETGKYQLWYQAYSGKKEGVAKPLECVVAYAESDDGIHFVKPEFDFFPFKDHAKTNIVLIGSGIDGGGDRYANSVVVDKNEKDPAKRYKMAYYDWSMLNGRPEPGLHVAFSPDGLRWTKHETGPLNRTSYGRYTNPPFADEDPVLETPVANKPSKRVWGYPLTMSDAVDVFWDSTRGAFVIYGKMWIDSPNGSGAWKHAMGRTESSDFLNWSKPELLLTPDDSDPADKDFHTSPVFLHKGMYFCLNQVLDRKDKGTIDIELMTSRDGFAWDRSYRDEWFIPHNPAADSFDGRAIFTNSTPVVLDDEIRFYYGAYNITPIGGGYEDKKPLNGIGLATIPLDRFGGIRPVAESAQTTMKKPLQHIGQITLKPIDLSAVETITVNADATDGAVRVEVLNADGYRVRGFEKAVATPLIGDSLAHQVRWKDKTPADLPDGRYMLRIHLEKATVYAVNLQ